MPVPTEVRRGDIYHVLSEQRILNLNRYRGLQVLDVSNLRRPSLEGRLPITGDPVELYPLGERALVIYNNNTTYFAAADSPDVELFSGAMVLIVDIKDRTQPKLVSRQPIAGNIVTSRVLNRGDRNTLIVVAQDAEETTRVASFDVSDGELKPIQTLPLSGVVQAVQATGELLLVLRRESIDLVDISGADGTLVARGSVAPSGMLQDRYNVKVTGNLLRVVSSNGTASYLQTYSLADLQAPTLLATCEIAPRSPDAMSAGLSTTLLLEDRAFIVSDYQPDAFHAFSLARDGQCTEHPEYVTSGSDTFLAPAFDDTRLVGIGHDDPMNGDRLAISLYDTSLDNSMPLVARASVDLPASRSEATWDDRAFMVLEDFVSAEAEDGTPETWMILLPYDDLDLAEGTGSADTQIFTFSDHTLTKRGTLHHGTPVRRAFQVQPLTAANLSDDQLSLFDTVDTDAPSELARLDLAPDYSRVLVYNNCVVRVREPLYASDSAQLQILERAADLDGSKVLTSIDLPRGSSYYQLGQLLITISTTRVGAAADAKYNSRVQVYDLTSPQNPFPRGSLETDRIGMRTETELLTAGFVDIETRADAALGASSPRGTETTATVSQSFVVGETIALISTVPHEKKLAAYRRCVWTPPPCTSTDPAVCAASRYEGAITCTTPEGGEEACTGRISLCKQDVCEPLDERPAGTREVCEDSQELRKWQSFQLDGIDLSNPDKPVLAERVEFPADEEAISALADGTKLYLSYQVPMSEGAAAQASVKQYAHVLSFWSSGMSEDGPPMSLPGRLIHARGETVYTEGYEWNGDTRSLSLARLAVAGEQAELLSQQSIGDRNVWSIRMDESAERLIVSSGEISVAAGKTAFSHTVTMLDAATLKMLSETDLNVPAVFAAAVGGRAMFLTGQGMLIYEIADPEKLRATAFYPADGAIRDLYFSGNEVIYAAGRKGVQRFNTKRFNLLTN
jgi:hypothetical protein